MNPQGIHCVAPSLVCADEPFVLKVRVKGPVYPVPNCAEWDTQKPALQGPFNLNASRGLRYYDNCLPEWRGELVVDGGAALSGPDKIEFDGKAQGAFPGDVRPIKVLNDFRLDEPGFHFIRLADPASGVEGWSNPIRVVERTPECRIYWGDPHWQTFFSDGVRCPEELYAFARDETFLDFGAITDHMEAVTDRQWDYFQAVTNDYNEDGRFVTLIGQEWTKHNPGHRNVYYRADRGPCIRSTDPRYDSLEKLWAALDGMPELDPIAIPHHPANVIMGVDWSAGWNPKYEKAVEIYSGWGNSERPAEAGNPRPLRAGRGEQAGRHVVDALKMGYDMAFVGGGDIHDGRPGDSLVHLTTHPRTWPGGLTALFAPQLTRDAVYDAIKEGRTYATTPSRIYLDAPPPARGGTREMIVEAASEDGIAEAAITVNGETVETLPTESAGRVVRAERMMDKLNPGDFCYVRITTRNGDMAWSSPWRA